MEPLAIYIHWPFCKKKCPYCDFNSHVTEHIDHMQWLHAYLQQLEYFQHVLRGKRIRSIFFGGGTPSLMSPVIVEKIIDKLASFLDTDVEITLEANPTSSDKDKFRSFKMAGVNRISIGVQSLLDSELKFLGREHSPREAIDAIEAASIIFARYSIDMIYARPKQTMQAWVAELKEALRYCQGHISLYQLTIEEGTPFYAQHKNKVFICPGQSLAADMYEFTAECLHKHGFEQYEISNYAKSGHACKHNMCYWQYDEFLGIGPGAHSRVRLNDTPLYTSMVMLYSPDKWLLQTQLNGQVVQHSQRLSIEEMAIEYVLMQLRLEKGMDVKGFEHKFHHSLNAFLDLHKLQHLASQGMLEHSQDRIRLKERGKLLMNYVASEILKVTA